MESIGKALATIEAVDDDLKYGPHGGFTCIASTPSEDRDGDNLYQEEWKSLPEHITVDLDHGMSVATTVGSGRPYFNADGNVQTDVGFSSIARAQEARTLVKEGHIRTVSVAFMTDKNKKSGEPRRELLNLGIVAVPSNREAVILDSKALDARAEELAAQRNAEADDKSVAENKNAKIYVDIIPRFDYDGFAANLKAAMTASGVGGDGALVQAIHDASSHLGAACPVIEVADPNTGASSGANKSVDAEAIITPNEARELEGLEKFEKSLDEIIPSDESPAVAAAASDEEPAPAEKAADDSDALVKARAMQMSLSLLTPQSNI